MGAPNLGFLFYKDYYRDDDNNTNVDDMKIINIRNTQLLKQSLDLELVEEQEAGKLTKNVNKTLYFKTTYPGLLIGSGYKHGIDSDEEFKIGFYFDYTTGLPEIPASSIKGLLRSPFSGGHYDYIVFLLKEELKLEKDVKFVEELEKEIFDGLVKGMDNTYSNLPMGERDIFFNGIIDYKETKKYLKNMPLLSGDYITPHGDRLCEPTPIKFIKVCPNVVFSISFNLKDRLLTAGQKAELFKRIILDLGLGAKTNVGYGKFQLNYLGKLEKING